MRLIVAQCIILLTLVFSWSVQPVTALEVPPLKGRINDYAHMLTPATTQALEQKLAGFEQETSNQVVLLTIPSLEGDVIESFAIKVAEAWKIGQKDKNNGVLLILAQKERKIRIEVGTGLQGVLPDITAGQIIRNVIAPHLRAGNFDQGISAGLAAIIDATKGEFKASAADQQAAKKKKGSTNGLFILLILAGLVVTAIAGASSRAAGTLAGAISLPTAAAVGLGAAVGKLVLLGLLGGAAGLLISLLMRLIAAGGGGGGWGGGGPTIFYGGGGGGFSSGGDDGGFSGGGGDFDGGGSSDDW